MLSLLRDIVKNRIPRYTKAPVASATLHSLPVLYSGSGRKVFVKPKESVSLTANVLTHGLGCICTLLMKFA